MNENTQQLHRGMVTLTHPIKWWPAIETIQKITTLEQLHWHSREECHRKDGMAGYKRKFLALNTTLIFDTLWLVHTIQNAPGLVRSRKLSWIGQE